MAYIPLAALMGALTYPMRYSDDSKPKRREGYWIKISPELAMTDWYECSECHERYVTRPVWCPNCKCFMNRG